MKKIMLALPFILASSSVMAISCEGLNYRSGDVISVNTSSRLGTRIELPSNLTERPMITNAQRWDVLGDVGSKHIMIAPVDNEKGGESTMIFAFTEGGKAFDIRADRVLNDNKNDSCVIVGSKSKFSRASGYKQPVKPVTQSVVAQPIEQVKKPTEVDTKQVINNAVKEYQKLIFTNYKWKQSGSFFGEAVLSDIYDDGRQTFIRLNKPHQRNITIETINKNSSMFHDIEVVGDNLVSFDGVYTKFVVSIADTKVNVTR